MRTISNGFSILQLFNMIAVTEEKRLEETSRILELALKRPSGTSAQLI